MTRSSNITPPNLTNPETISEWIDHWTSFQPDLPAIVEPGRPALTYFELQREVLRIRQCLCDAGLGRDDRVAVVFDSGVDLALTLLATSSYMTCAPVNPSLKSSELESYLKLIKATAVLLPETGMQIAHSVASSSGLPVVTLQTYEAGTPTPISAAVSNSASVHDNNTKPHDIAFLLPTSGTTSTPKIVAVSHLSACADARNIIRFLELTSEDRCLNVMPLFHVHALFAGLLGSLIAGSRFISTPGFSADRFFLWLDEYHPTWYSAAPTIHQSVVNNARDPKNQNILSQHRLRFVRSAAAPLPMQLLKNLEDTLGVPVIETYGMTEVRTFITSNPMPPGHRKAGSVGKAVGLGLGIMDTRGKLLPTGESGEIVVRGQDYIRGYETDECTNTFELEDGWFRTGDEGKLDKDGYLFITGRIKEVIIRGGMNVSPLEVERGLLSGSEICEAVVFPTSHPTLGQDVAAAVVLKHGSTLTESAVRAHAFLHMAEFKVPSQILFMDHIPRSATGKVKRLMMAELLKTELIQQKIPATDLLEIELTEIFCEVLDLSSIGINDNFFAIGGDSLSGTHVINRVNYQFTLELSSGILFRHPSVSELATEIKKLPVE